MADQDDRRFVPPRPLPGEPGIAEELGRILRVDHAGELAAVAIYRGQRAVIGEGHRLSPVLREMEAQEEEHLERFNRLLREHHVRPSLLSPLWEAAGRTLGAVTALLGPHAAMAATAAVEEVIDEHYARQRDRLRQWPETAELAETVEKFRQEEVAHRDEALARGAERTPGYPLLSGLIKAGCRLAIRIAERV
ncbi:MAG: 2-nonaprenyl-3-methyl-6-methoxy-1,4-benzoquinol hydroxylase [Rhodothalassiaceae bacterium]|nr:MAG: 2-nonaprenyl-3-methyl-6-methoxy-1,4-benzoquinol hydroxylase [Rhodothalassiaceae bacterium]